MSVWDRLKEFFGVKADVVTQENTEKLLERWYPAESEWEEDSED